MRSGYNAIQSNNNWNLLEAWRTFLLNTRWIFIVVSPHVFNRLKQRIIITLRIKSQFYSERLYLIRAQPLSSRVKDRYVFNYSMLLDDWILKYSSSYARQTVYCILWFLLHTFRLMSQLHVHLNYLCVRSLNLDFSYKDMIKLS